MSSGRERILRERKRRRHEDQSMRSARQIQMRKMIQAGDMRAGADDLGSEETKISQDEKNTPDSRHSVNKRTRADTLTFSEIGVHTVSKLNPGMDPHKREDR